LEGETQRVDERQQSGTDRNVVDGAVLEFSAWSPVTAAPSFEPARSAEAAIRRTGRAAITT
jgi:hypothetical protein